MLGVGTLLAWSERVHAWSGIATARWMRPLWIQFTLVYFHLTYQPELWRHRKLTRQKTDR